MWLPPSTKVFLASEATDMRNSIDGLCSLAKTKLQGDVFSGHLFVFFGRQKDRVKILFWDRGGFVVFYKRLEKGRFRLPPVDNTSPSISLDSTQLFMLLDGIDVTQVTRPKKWTPKAA